MNQGYQLRPSESYGVGCGGGGGAVVAHKILVAQSPGPWFWLFGI